MKHFLLFLFTFLYSPYLWAAATSTTKYKLPSETTYQHTSGWSVLVPTFVIHGIKPVGGAEEDMPRKMDPEGNTVLTPGLGVEYTALDGFMVMGAMFKDCYNGLAGAIQAGQFFRIDRDMKWGFSAGIYARQTPLNCQTTTGFNGEPIEECQSIDGLNWGATPTIGGYTVDILPMPFLHFSYALLNTRDLQVHLRLMSNIVLNEFGLSIPF